MGRKFKGKQAAAAIISAALIFTSVPAGAAQETGAADAAWVEETLELEDAIITDGDLPAGQTDAAGADAEDVNAYDEDAGAGSVEDLMTDASDDMAADEIIDPEDLILIEEETEILEESDLTGMGELTDETAETLFEGTEPQGEGETSYSGYVLMNIPYADFYAAELGTQDDTVDAVSSTTYNKPRTAGLAGGSYHVNADGRDISGVIYPVKVDDQNVLQAFTQVTDESSVSITVTNRGQTTTTEFTGKDALFESENYAWYALDEAPAYYKSLTGTGTPEDPFVFGAVQGETKTVAGVSADMTVGARHADIEIKLTGTEGIEQGDAVSGVILSTQSGRKYGLRHVANIWRATEIGWNFGEMNLMGEQIVNIRYITRNAVIDYPVDIAVSQAGYVLMNIPYAKFYEAELGDGAQAVDAVASATKNKPRTGTLAGGSYHVNSDGTDISGVTYPVFVEDLNLLDSEKEVKDDAVISITVTNRGKETTTVYEGRDTLFESADYAWYRLDTKPARYKKLETASVNGQTVFNFSAVSGRAAAVNGVTGSVTTGARHADIEIKLAGTEGITQGDKISGVIVTDAAGVRYGLRHIANLWRGTEIGWNEDELLQGENTITNIRYITQDAVIDYPVSIPISISAGAVEKQLNELKAEEAADSREAVAAAQAAYDALDDARKALISQEAKDNLAAAQAVIAKADEEKAAAEKAAAEKAAAEKAAAEKAAAEKAAAEKAAAEKAAAEKAAAEKAAAEKAQQEETVISFGSKTVQKKLNKAGTATKRITIRKGKKLSLKASASGGAVIKYKSSNKKIATVTKKGVIKAKKKGKATITVSAGGKKIKIKIRVK